MDHFNAMFEDKKTKSWWRQATGEAVAGKLKGEALKEIPSQQMRLSAWLRQNPASLILQPDPAFQKQYDHLTGFDLGTIMSGLEKKDTGSWKPKSWVIGIQYNKLSKAYDWDGLLLERIINDSIGNLKLAMFLEKDNASFHVWNRVLNNQPLSFVVDGSGIRDQNTQFFWNEDGLCTDGPLKGRQLLPVQASQEFWHSWQTFHPGTLINK